MATTIWYTFTKNVAKLFTFKMTDKAWWVNKLSLQYINVIVSTMWTPQWCRVWNQCLPVEIVKWLTSNDVFQIVQEGIVIEAMSFNMFLPCAFLSAGSWWILEEEEAQKNLVVYRNQRTDVYDEHLGGNRNVCSCISYIRISRLIILNSLLGSTDYNVTSCSPKQCVFCAKGKSPYWMSAALE